MCIRDSYVNKANLYNSTDESLNFVNKQLDIFGEYFSEEQIKTYGEELGFIEDRIINSIDIVQLPAHQWPEFTQGHSQGYYWPGPAKKIYSTDVNASDTNEFLDISSITDGGHFTFVWKVRMPTAFTSDYMFGWTQAENSTVESTNSFLRFHRDGNNDKWRWEGRTTGGEIYYAVNNNTGSNGGSSMDYNENYKWFAVVIDNSNTKPWGIYYVIQTDSTDPSDGNVVSYDEYVLSSGNNEHNIINYFFKDGKIYKMYFGMQNNSNGDFASSSDLSLIHI